MAQNLKAKFMPTDDLGKHDSYKTDGTRIEFVKEGVVANFQVAESCLSKCQINFNSKDGEMFNSSENTCMTKCFNKYLDANLLIDKEYTMYTNGFHYA